MLILGLLLFIVSLLFVFDKYAYIGPGVLRFSDSEVSRLCLFRLFILCSISFFRLLSVFID